MSDASCGFAARRHARDVWTPCGARDLRCVAVGPLPPPAPAAAAPRCTASVRQAAFNLTPSFLNAKGLESLVYRPSPAAADTRAAVAACGAFLTENEHTALACAQEAESIADRAAECPEICAILLSVRSATGPRAGREWHHACVGCTAAAKGGPIWARESCGQLADAGQQQPRRSPRSALGTCLDTL